jgi:uncharacterized protein YidB (DUF937 family)
MSIFESIVNVAIEAATKNNPEYAGLAQAILSFVQKQGGVEGIQKKLEDKGFGDAASSWISNDDNQSISGSDLIKVFGKGAIGDIAEKAGVSEDGAADKVAELLPVLINGITPEGKSTGNDLLEAGLGMLKNKMF